MKKTILVYALFGMYASTYASTDTVNSQQIVTVVFQERFNAGCALFQTKQYEQALETFKALAQIAPTCPELHFNLGLCYQLLNQMPEACAHFEKTVQLSPDCLRAHYFVGMLHQAMKDYDKALEIFEEIGQKYTQEAKPHIHKGQILYSQGKIPEAVTAYQHAITLNPNDKQALFELAAIFALNNFIDAAELLYRKILHIDSTCVDTMLNLAHVYRYKSQYKDAIPLYYIVLSMYPENTKARAGLAQALLAQGEFSLGFQELNIWKHPEYPMTADICRMLRNSDIMQDKIVFLRKEMYAYDTILSLQFVQELKKTGAYIIVEASEELLPLLRNCPFIDGLISPLKPGQRAPFHHIAASMLGLGCVFASTQTYKKPTQPSLTVNPEKINSWRTKIGNTNSFKIGICWHDTTRETAQTIPLSDLLGLFLIPGIEIYSVQPGFSKAHAQSLLPDIKIHAFDELYDGSKALEDTAAVMKHMDLIISTDGLIGHIAGALGVPTYILISHNADWRWLGKNDQSIWFSNVRVFQQEANGVWQPVIQQLIESVSSQALNKKSATPIVTAPVSIGELFDKITILDIKKKRIQDTDKLKNVEYELAKLEEVAGEISMTSILDDLVTQLHITNEALWDIEDQIRDEERKKQFGDKFIHLARNVYRENDKRYALKNAINKLTGSSVIEEKSYEPY